MKRLLLASLLTTLLAACHKSNDNSGSPIATSSDAKLIFSMINTQWNGTLKPLLTKKVQTYTNQAFDSAGIKMIVNGSYSTTSFTGSSGSTYSSTADMTITFQQYKSNGITLNGTMRFYETHSTRTDCGTAGCATASHMSISYKTADTTAASAVAINYSNTGGKTLSDNIVLTSSREYSTFAVTMKNKQGQKFSFSY
ncbi:MAG: hypothetical protein JST68_14745 [Bacteroidetes bacterium]|nr:hypothetical protein [Bacteroidota bacterium]